MSRIDEIIDHWCNQFMLEQNWPANITVEEKLNRYIFPQLHEFLPTWNTTASTTRTVSI